MTLQTEKKLKRSGLTGSLFAKITAVVLFSGPLLYLYTPSLRLSNFCLMNQGSSYCWRRWENFKKDLDCLEIGLNAQQKTALKDIGVTLEVYLDNNAGFLYIDNNAIG